MKTIIIGRDATCDIVIDQPMISSQHCRLTVRPDGVLVEDLGSGNGTAVGTPENRISAPTLVQSDSTIFLGSWTVELTQALAYIGVSIDARSSGSIVVGRDPSCDVVIDKPMVSSRHCRLTQRADGVLVEDLGSSNGVSIGTPGNRISGSATVNNDAAIYLGSYRLVLAEITEHLNAPLYPDSSSEPATPSALTPVSWEQMPLENTIPEGILDDDRSNDVFPAPSQIIFHESREREIHEVSNPIMPEKLKVEVEHHEVHGSGFCRGVRAADSVAGFGLGCLFWIIGGILALLALGWLLTKILG